MMIRLLSKFAPLSESKFFILFLLTGWNSLVQFFLQVTGRLSPISYWPSIDNLPGLINLNDSDYRDNYSYQLNSSPRRLTIEILNLFSILIKNDFIDTLTVLGTIVTALGLPLFFLCSIKVLKRKYVLNRTAILTFIAFSLMMNANYVHLIEINDFPMNPFQQGATSSNCAALILMVGVLFRNKWAMIALSLLAFLIHPSTSFFLSLIFYFNQLKQILYMLVHSVNIRYRIILAVLAASVLILIISKTYSSNRQGWDYYILTRAPHHYVLETANFDHVWIVFLALFMLCLTMLGSNQFASKKFFLPLIGFFALLVSGVADFRYSIVLIMASFALAVDHRTFKKVLYLIAIQSALLMFQSFPVDAISRFFALFLPGTRLLPLLSLYLIASVAIGSNDVINNKVGDRFQKRSMGNLHTPIIALTLFSTIFCIIQTTNSYSDSFNELKVKVEETYPTCCQNNELVLPIDIDTTGWREFKNANIYIDDFVIWADLNQFAKRSNFRSDFKELLRNNSVSRDRLIELREKAGVGSPLILVLKRDSGFNHKNLICDSDDYYIMCQV